MTYWTILFTVIVTQGGLVTESQTPLPSADVCAQMLEPQRDMLAPYFQEVTTSCAPTGVPSASPIPRPRPAQKGN